MPHVLNGVLPLKKKVKSVHDKPRQGALGGSQVSAEIQEGYYTLWTCLWLD